MSLYNIKTQTGVDFLITKFDDDLNPQGSYVLIPSGDDPSIYLCDCPANARDTCRHRQMLPHFINTNRVNSNWVMDWDAGQAWRQYVGVLGDEMEPLDELDAAELPDGVEKDEHIDHMIDQLTESEAKELVAEVKTIESYQSFASDEPHWPLRSAAEGAEPSTLAAIPVTTPSQEPVPPVSPDRRGEASPDFKRRV